MMVGLLGPLFFLSGGGGEVSVWAGICHMKKTNAVREVRSFELALSGERKRLVRACASARSSCCMSL